MINEPVKNGYPTTAPVRASVPAASAVGTTAAASSDAAADSTRTQPEKAQPDPGKVREAVSKLNDHVQNLRRTLSFSIEESTGRTVIKVYDAETEELIRQIPPEETLRLAELIEEKNTNLFIEERA